MRNSRHTFLNFGKREQRGSKRLVKQSYRPLSTPALSLFLSCRLQTPPNFSLCPVSPCASSPSSRIAHTWRDGERQTDNACARHDIFSSFMASPPHSTSYKARGGLVVESTGRWSKGVATGNANELHERRQIEQHTTMVSSWQPSPAHPLRLLRRYDKSHRKLVMHKYNRLCGYRQL